MEIAYDHFSTCLTISLSPAERASLRDDFEDCLDSDAAMIAALDPVVCNTSLEWVDAAEIGGLTNAPILGKRNSSGRVIGSWAWMSYQVTSLLRELVDVGHATLVGEQFGFDI